MLSVREIVFECAPVFERHAMVDRAFLFGSYSRDEQDELSDVDICYDISEDHRPIGLAFFGEHGELRRDLEDALGVSVDLLTTPDEDSCVSPSQRRFAREVRRDRRRIYERS